MIRWVVVGVEFLILAGVVVAMIFIALRAQDKHWY